MEKNPTWNYPSVSPTGMPSLGPSVFAEVSKIVTLLENENESNENGTLVSENVESEEEESGGTVEVVNEEGHEEIYDFEGTLVQSMLTVDDNSTSSSSSSTTNNSTTEDSSTSTTDNNNNDTTTEQEEVGPTSSVSVTYRLSPTDDTFMEVWRPDMPLGTKDKLKIDASSEEDKKDNGMEGGVPTKFIQLKFGLGGIFKDVESMMMEMQVNNVCFLLYIVCTYVLVCIYLFVMLLCANSFQQYTQKLTSCFSFSIACIHHIIQTQTNM